MKDKEKQIEEMAQTMCEFSHSSGKCDCVNSFAPNCTWKDMATSVYNAGYRKITDSVVLSRECVSAKWIDLLTEFDEMGFEPTTLPPKDISLEEYTAFYKEKLLMCLAKESKETAEKIFNILYQWLDLENILKYGSVTIQKFDFLRKFREIYTQFGVEIKE